MAHSDSTLRQLLGIETETGFKRPGISYQRIIDNVRLLDDATLSKINDAIVSFGHGVFKKKDAAALHAKTDSFVVESNVHFPADYKLLWDSSYKAIATINWYRGKYNSISGWRKSGDWYKSLKNLSRAIGRASASGGAGKKAKLLNAAKQYLAKATSFRDKLGECKSALPINDLQDVSKMLELERFIKLMSKHINLVERRLIKDEKIPHAEKIFSIFEEYTEWITKGKQRPNVELGKKVSITTDQYGLIIDYCIMENESDSEIVLSTADRILGKYQIYSWSFDKGYYHKDNKWLLETGVEKVVMPKKGKRTIEETEYERAAGFKKLKGRHSAIESNINELEHSGLDRCPDKGWHSFQRYVGLGIVAYNLKRIGKELIKQELKKQERNKRRQERSAA